MDSVNGKEIPIEYMIGMLLRHNPGKAFSLTKIAEAVQLYSETGTLSAAISSSALVKILMRMEGEDVIKSEFVNNNAYFTLVE